MEHHLQMYGVSDQRSHRPSQASASGFWVTEVDVKCMLCRHTSTYISHLFTIGGNFQAELIRMEHHYSTDSSDVEAFLGTNRHGRRDEANQKSQSEKTMRF